MHRLIAWLAVPCCAALPAGCAGVGPAAGHFYPAHAASPDRVPVIVIPGLMGSRLVRASDGVEFWPGGTRKLLASDYLDLALRIDPVTLEPLDDGLVPGGIFEGAVGQDFYGRLVYELRVAGGYQQISPGRPVVQQRARLYVFTYDWRQDNVKTVRKLDKLIERSVTTAPASAESSAARSQPGFVDSDYEHGRGAQGNRKKSWLGNIFD